MKKTISQTLKKMGLHSKYILFREKYFPSALQNEQKEYSKVIANFYKDFFKKGDVVFDVGANYGNRTEVFLNLGAKVVSFEPQTICYDYLNTKFANKIKLEKVGLGEKEGESVFFTSDNSTTVATLSKNWIEKTKESRFSDIDWNHSEKIKISTLDIMIKKHGKPNFIKIDVEGFEYEVLKGLSSPINFLSFEYAVPESFDNTINSVKHLASLSSNYVFNYSTGETFVFEEKQWLSASEMIEKINSKSFLEGSNGDLYAKLLK
jgi:FkbM family methyltransferase